MQFWSLLQKQSIEKRRKELTIFVTFVMIVTGNNIVWKFGT